MKREQLRDGTLLRSSLFFTKIFPNFHQKCLFLWYNVDMDIQKIRFLCDDDNIEVTQHMLIRFQQRHISYREIKESIMNGEIIKEYPDDKPFPSCLVLGFTKKKRGLHIVIGIAEDKLWLITAYEPDKTQWNDDFRTKKEENI